MIIINIYTKKEIADRMLAEEYFKTVETLGLAPDKIGLFEPLKIAYSFEEAVNMWTKEEPGCLEDGLGYVGKAGGMIGKRKESSFRFYTYWWKHPDKRITNYIFHYLTEKTYRTYEKQIITYFKETTRILDAFYGYISYSSAEERQYRGGVDTKMPGVFWCNFFGNAYLQVLADYGIESMPWFKTEITNNGLLTYLAENPKQVSESASYETKIKNHFGEAAFKYNKEYIRKVTNL